jgi:AraC-like DNA-binding protein
MKTTRPLDRFPVVRARSVEEMRAVFAGVYGLSVLVEGNTRAVDVATNCYPMTDIILGYSKYSAHMGLVFPGTVDTFHIVPIRGRGEASVNGDVVPLHAGRGITVPRAANFAERFNTDYEHVVLTMNTGTLTDKASALAGTSIDRPLTFFPVGDDTSHRTKAFRNHLFFLVDQLNASTVPLPRLVLAEFEQTLMVMFLCSTRHSFSHLLDRAPADASVAQIRRAEEYIEANWRLPITLEALAAVTEMSAFELFRAFKNSRGYSPMEFADRVRLRYARELLHHADDMTAVAAVAAACGFGDFERFTRDYAQTFGEHPSQTLRSGKPGRPLDAG